MHSYDYLDIFNGGIMVGRYCGQRTGLNILLLTGYQIRIKFHSDNTEERRGFWIHFSAVPPHGKYFS